MLRTAEIFEKYDPITADFTHIRWLGDRKGVEKTVILHLRRHLGPKEKDLRSRFRSTPKYFEVNLRGLRTWHRGRPS